MSHRAPEIPDPASAGAVLVSRAKRICIVSSQEGLPHE